MDGPESIDRMDFVVVIGCCGHVTAPRGTSRLASKLMAKSICSIVHGATVSVNTRLGFQSALGGGAASEDGRHTQRSDQAKAKLRATNVPKERRGAIAAAVMAMMPKARPRAVTAETMPMMMAVIPTPAQRT